MGSQKKRRTATDSRSSRTAAEEHRKIPGRGITELRKEGRQETEKEGE